MLQIAKVLKSNGTDGGLLIGALDIELTELDTREPVFIYYDGLPVPLFIEDLQPRGTRKAIVHMTGIASLKDAEEVVGQGIFADWEYEDEDEADFTGWTIMNGPERVGVVTGMEPIPGNLCLYVDTGSGEPMIPLHEDFIISADPEARILVLDLPDGLL